MKRLLSAILVTAILATVSVDTAEARGRRKIKKAPTLWEQLMGK